MALTSVAKKHLYIRIKKRWPWVAISIWSKQGKATKQIYVHIESNNLLTNISLSIHDNMFFNVETIGEWYDVVISHMINVGNYGLQHAFHIEI